MAREPNAAGDPKAGTRAAARGAVTPAPVATSRAPGVLGRIVEERIRAYAREDGSTSETTRGPGWSERPRFAAALARPGLQVIAEVKRSSPSQGDIRPIDPVHAALAYRAGGAAALSVLTEPNHFGGALEHLAQVAHAMADGEGERLPVLRKDFVVHPRQVDEAAEAGASAVLLIAAVLGPELRAYLDYVQAQGLEALVEIHDEAELDLALDAGSRVVGVNNRDLRTLDIDLQTAPRLIRAARERGFEGVLVAESGYRNAEDIEPVRDLADAVLVGTSLIGQPDLAAAVAALEPGRMARGAP